MKLSSLRGAVCVDDLILAPSDVALPSLDATATPTGTATVTPTATATATATGTATATPSATQTVTVAPTYTSTSTRTATPGATVTNSVTPTTTATVTSTARAQTPTATPTYTPTIAATATSTPDPGNLLKNPSFEQKAGGLGVPPYWSVSSWATSKAWVVRGGVDDDGGALFLSGDGSSYAVFQDVPNLDGGVYRLSGWLSLPEISRGSMRLELAPLTRYGGPAGPPAWLSRSQPTGGWEYFEIDITGPPNLSKMRVQAKVEGMRGSAYLDGMQLRRVR